MVVVLFRAKIHPNDRSAAYALRHVAKSLVAANFVTIVKFTSYAIGVAEPTSIFVNTFESERKPVKEIEQDVPENLTFPCGIIQSLELLALNTENFLIWSFW